MVRCSENDDSGCWCRGCTEYNVTTSFLKLIMIEFCCKWCGCGASHNCSQGVRVTGQLFGSRQQKPVWSAWDLSKEPARCFLVGQSRTRACSPGDYSRFGYTHLLQCQVLHFVFHNFLLHTDILLLIAKYWLRYVNVCFGRIGRLHDLNKQRFVPCPILKISIHGASTIDWPCIMVNHSVK